MTAAPLRFDVPVGPQQLIDRRDELAELARSAGRRTAIRLAAPRRFGKTSVLHAHVAAMREAGHRAVVVDLSDVGDTGAVLARVAHAYRGLDPAAARVVQRATRRAGLTIGPAGLGITVERGPAPSRDQLEPVLLELLDVPARLHERDGGLCVVCFDEFQDLLQAGTRLDGSLRSVIQHHADAAAYVYAGSQPSLLRALFTERERPLFGQAQPLELGPLPADETADALTAVLASEGFDEPDVGTAIDAVVAAMTGHPQRTVLVTHHLLRRLEDADPAEPVDPDELVELAVADALRATDDVHRATWRGCSRAESQVLRLVAERVPPTGADARRLTGLATSTLGDAVERLVTDGQHLVPDGPGWRLVDPLLTLWLRRETV
ncbi:MAG: hypothetical protein AB7G37_12795 [Solirubrobacteraceae bacterium]